MSGTTYQLKIEMLLLRINHKSPIVHLVDDVYDIYCE